MLTHAILPNGNLMLTLVHREDLWDAIVAGSEGSQPALPRSDALMYNVFEDFLCNSSYEWVRPEEIGALTDAPIIGVDVVRDEYGTLIPGQNVNTSFWYYEPYALKSPVQDLFNHRIVVFRKVT